MDSSTLKIDTTKEILPYSSTLMVDTNSEMYEDRKDEVNFARRAEKIKTLKDYRLIRLLGRGAFGEVWEAQDLDNGKIIALKIINMTGFKYNQLKEEIINLQRISLPQCHPFLVCYYGHVFDYSNNVLLIEMELINGSTLNKYAADLRKTDNQRLYNDLLLIAKDLGKAISFVHSKNLIHRDIKPGNIIITKDYVPRLIDFGIACETDLCEKRGQLDHKSECCKGLSGTVPFMAPELVKTGISFPQSDMWSLGVTLYKAATGDYPFEFPNRYQVENMSDNDMKKARMNIIAEREPKTLETSNLLLNDVVNSLLVKDMRFRLTPQQLEIKLNFI